jgi:hypothetical protein
MMKVYQLYKEHKPNKDLGGVLKQLNAELAIARQALLANLRN